MTAVDGIGEVSFFQGKTTDKKVVELTLKNINSLLDKNVLTKEMAEKLKTMFLNGEVNFGTDGLTVEEAKNLDVDAYNEVITRYNALQSQIKTSSTSSANQAETQATTSYTVQAGDTPEIIAKKMGLTGQEAKDFARQIKEDAQKAGKYHRFGFRAGDVIQLPGDYSKKIAQMKNDGNYHTDLKKINEDFIAKTNARNAQKPETKPTQETKTEAVEEAEETSATSQTTSSSVNKPQNAQKISLKDLKKDEQGRYIIPQGNWSIDSSELPADDVKFVLENEKSVLVFNGPVKSAFTSNYKEPEQGVFNIRFSEPKDKRYKSGDFEFQNGKYYYKGKPIDESELDIKYSEIKNADGEFIGQSISITKKDTVMDQDSVIHTSRNIEITGKGKFYADEISCPITANVGSFEIGKLSNGATGSIKGKGTIHDIIGDNTYVNLYDCTVRNMAGGSVNGENINVNKMVGGNFMAQGVINELRGGTVEHSKANIDIMNGGHVLAANNIKVMQGGYLDLYIRRSERNFTKPGKVTIENYIAGRIDACDGHNVIIKNGLDDYLLAQADSPLQEKRGGKISDKEIVDVPENSGTSYAGIGTAVWNWIKSLF